MRTKSKFIFSIIGLLIIILAGLFLIYHHQDNLKNHIPANVSVYIHTYPQLFNQINTDQQNLILSTATIFNFSQNQIKKIIQLCQKEIAIIKIPNQNWQIATFKNQNLINYLENQQISYKTTDSIIYFPQNQSSVIEISQSLAKNPLFKPKKFNFSDLYLYYSNNEQVFAPDFIGKQYLQPFFAYLSGKDNYFVINTNIKTNVFNDNNFASLLNSSANYRILAKNINLSLLPLTASNVAENFEYSLLKEFNQIDEFIDFEDKFLFVINSEQKSAEQIKSLILQKIALLLPQEQEKILPDNTIAINLVAKPENWQFTQVTAQKSQLIIDELNFDIQIFQINGKIIISNNIDFEKYNSQNVNNSIDQTKCHPADSYILFNNLNNTGIDKILINKSKIFNTIKICIE